MGSTIVKKVIITGFIIFGTALGLANVWFRQNTDAVFFLNIPGMWLGDVIYTLSVKLFGDPHSSQAHYTIPWLLRIPQVYVPISILFWGILGMLLAIFLKPKTIGWIVGLYFVVFGIIYLLA
jgi:hypothetical protein